MRHAVAPMLLASLLLAAPTAGSAEQSYRADYTVTLLGLPVAKASFDSTFTARDFRIEGSLSSAGIARVFDKTTGTTRVEGRIGKDGAQPRTFSSAYKSGKKSSRTTIRYSGGRVASVSNTPEPRKGKRWVEVRESHLRAALDPLSSTLIRTDDPRKVCNRTIQVFDGEMRLDLKLTQRATTDARITCDARFLPVSGYRQGRKQIEFLKNQSRISITFAELGGTGFYTPVDASVGTQIGTLRIAATHIEAR